jgi:acetyl-CoA decarbonylase/synthase complex subunit beta
MSMFKDIPVDVGVIYEGQKIRRPDMQVEFGGPDVPVKFELVAARSMNEVDDGKVMIIGPDIKDLKEGSSLPLGIHIEVAGAQVEKDLEPVIERRIHEYCNFIEGFMHLNQRYDVWMRLSKGAYKKGLNSFEYIGKVLQRLFKAELPIIEKIQTTFITDPAKVQAMREEALKIYEARDARARGIKDEEVDVFYGCVLCQSFAPTHMCVLSPNRYSLCGALGWFDGRASARIDPKGPNFKIEKGECLDPVRGEYTGVNAAIKEKSLGEIQRISLYSMFDQPHTSCGCFETVGFYIPEVDGVGIVDRDFKGTAVNGLPFSTMADQTSGGRQTPGFHGISMEYMRSKRFLQADGGWSRVVYVASAIKERVKASIPQDLTDKLPTEKDVTNVEELKTFLQSKGHPVVARWKEAPPEAAEEEEVPAEEAAAEPTPMMIPAEALAAMPASMGGFKIVLKDVKIHAARLIVGSGEKPKRE